MTKEEDKIEIKDVERPPPAAPPPPAVEHILPGGIGTYSITYFNQRITKPEGNLFMMAQASSTNRTDENNSNSSSYTGSGFTLWDESAVKKGKTGKENNVVDRPVPRGKSSFTSLLARYSLCYQLGHTSINLESILFLRDAFSSSKDIHVHI